MHDKKVIFLHNPKVMGKEITRWLRLNSKAPQLLYKAPTQFSPDLGHLNLWNYHTYVSQLARDTYTHIVFLRDPIERFHTGYKEIKRHDVGRRYMEHYRLCSREDMIEHLYRYPEELYHPHLVWICPQHLFVYDKDGRKIPHIYHYQYMSDAVKDLKEWLDIAPYPNPIQQHSPSEMWNDRRLQWLYRTDLNIIFENCC